MLTPLEVAQGQFDAYNARDLDRFMAFISDDIKTYRMPATTPGIVGKAQLAAFYASERFNRPLLRAELLSRTAMGNKVFDHERVTGVGDAAIEMVVVFEINAGLVETIWTFPAA